MKEGNLKYLIICYLTAFVGGFCVMTIEIIAGRLIARYLGVSLYTWTSVIGVVLAGIALGNYIGGRIADKVRPQKALSVLFILAAISCALVPALNNLMGSSAVILHFPSWGLRIALHVAIIFFLPSCALGMISPIVAKSALDQGLTIGRTIGNIYASSAAGSIIGTFVTGFFLIAHIGTVAIVWMIAGILGVIGFFYGKKNKFSYVGIAVVLLILFLSFVPFGWARTTATNLYLIEKNRENIVYAKDSQYSYIRIVKDTNNPKLYSFSIDHLVQTAMNINDSTSLEYADSYYKTFANIVEEFKDKEEISILNLGGGGYLFPCYTEKKYPASRIEVVEIDPEVTEAAMSAFGLSRDSSIRIHHMDARNYIDDLVRRKRLGEDIAPFDFIFCDVFSGSLAVPYHLTTYEFNERVAQLLTPKGLYVLNLIDSMKSLKFLRAAVRTLEETFGYTYVLLPQKHKKMMGSAMEYGTFVIIASQDELDTEVFKTSGFDAQLLSEIKEELPEQGLEEQVVFTDDFAPVDNLLNEVFRARGKFGAFKQSIDKAAKLAENGKLEAAIEQFEKILRKNPNSALIYNNIASLNAWQGRYATAMAYYRKALMFEPEYKPAIIGLGNALNKKGRKKEAIVEYRKALKLDANLAGVYVSLGNVSYGQGNIEEAIENYQKALEIEPALESAQKNLNMAVMNLIATALSAPAGLRKTKKIESINERR